MTFETTLPHLIEFEDKSSILANRIRKNYRHLRKWGLRTKTNCFRIFDRDIKEFPLAIDFYGGRFAVHIYNDRTDPREDLAEAALSALVSLFGVPQEAIYVRNRMRRGRTEQYEKQADEREFFTVFEYGVPFWVNLADYLDSGLFLDHRETRQLVAKMAEGKRVLNLFAYTCAFSVHAAIGGASFTKSVDLSNTYCDWGSANFELNGLSLKQNVVVRDDCLKFLDFEEEEYDLIVIDPPTLSRSKKMDDLFDIQRDYVVLLKKALMLLKGTLFFSTNSRRFVFDRDAFLGWDVTEMSTRPLDFRDPKIHRCWKLTRRAPSL